jgi:glucokinase
MISFGIDIGGTFIKIIAINETGKVLKNQKFTTPCHLSSSKFLNSLAEIINAWKKELKTKKAIIGIGIAGDTDNKKGILRFAPNIPWPNLKIASGLKKLTNCECFVSNDANMAAFGIYKKELKGKYKDILVLTLGTGIGGGIIIDGKLYQGATGTAGEFGHMKIGDIKTGNICGCGARGCLESYIGTNSLKKLILKTAKENPKSKLAKLLEREKLSIKILSEAAEIKDGYALSIWDYFGTCLGHALANLILSFNPEVIIFSGGVAGGAKYFVPAIYKVLKEQKIKEPFRNIKLLISKTKDIGALGSALYALSVNDEK